MTSIIKSRISRLTRFANKFVTGKDGGETLGRFMSIEATIDNADTDIELIRLGYYDTNK